MPSASLKVLRQRAELLRKIRNFFAERDVLEVTTPALSPGANPDPMVEPLQLAGERGNYLRCSPEFALKRLLAAGSGDIYELGPVFRAAETGRMHSREFTMLEWYRQDWDYRDLILEVAALVRHAGAGKFDDWQEQTVSYCQLFEEYAGISPYSATQSDFRSINPTVHIEAPEMSRTEWLDLTLSAVIQPALPTNKFTFVHEYPVEQAALARIRPGSPPVAERFELFLGQMELANGYQELTDAQEQRKRFESDNNQRREAGLCELPLDRQFLTALDDGLPVCAGVALGVDRLLMAILGDNDINAVLPFGTKIL
jgi:lysyl-tRNA synthetase class 2